MAPEMNFMIYGLGKFYNDELIEWNRSVIFHKDESGALIRKIAVVLKEQLLSVANQKESNSYIDQMMVQQQEFDHVSNRILSQQQRLERSASLLDQQIELTIQQDSLRSRLQNLERNFLRSKYAGYNFLSIILKDQVSLLVS